MDENHGVNDRKKSLQRPNKTILSRTLFLLVACGIVAFVVLAIKLYTIQISKHDYYEELAISQQLRETTITASRGTIYDCNMNVLAMSATAETVFISPAEIIKYDEDAELIARTLSEILEVDYDKIIEKTTRTDSWYETIKTKIDESLADRVREFINEYHLKGVHLEETSKRYYTNGSLACHIIGFVGTDNYGLEGIESAFDSTLQGTDGRVVRLTDANGTDLLFTNYEDYVDAKDGDSIVLTIDSTIQYYLEKNLEQAIADCDVQNGAAGIVMDVNTGAILAMASYGNYDLNSYLQISDEAQTEIDQIEDESEREKAYSDALYLQWRNKALADTYEPGSVFKIITMAVGLEEGVIDQNSSFYCGGSIDVLGRDDPLHCWKTAGHGSQNITQAAENSCNCAFVDIGMKIGSETFYKYMDAFGFFDSTGIELSGEGRSLWWSEDVFCNPDNLSQLAAASFGQTFTITPLQLITAVSAVANGGNLMKPYLVKQTVDSDGNVVTNNEPTVVRQVISEETSEEVCEILESVVANGTGKNAYVAGYRIAGKTGTSEKVAQIAQQGDANKEYIVSFLGFAPANDPQVAVLVLLDTPDNSETGTYISGGAMAAPVVGSIMSDVLPYLGVEPQYTDEEKAAVDVTVKNFKNMSVAEASSVITNMGLDVKVVGDGDTVTDQLPAANCIVASGTEIIIYAGDTKPDKTVTVPNIYGMSVSEARQTLDEYGLFMSTKGATSGVVASKQSIEAGTVVQYGSVIEVTFTDQSNLGHY